MLYTLLTSKLISIICNCVYRFPQQSSSGINSGWILSLMPPTSWAAILASLLSVVLYFNVASQVVRRAWKGIRLVNTEIDLFPFRSG